MINVSNDFKKRMEENRDFKSYAEITFTDGEQITLDSSQFTASNSSLTDGAGVSTFPLGVAIEKVAQFEIINDEQQYADKDFLGAKIRLYTDFQLDDIDPWVGKQLLKNSATKLVSLLNGAQATFEQNISVSEWQAKDAIRVSGTSGSTSSLFGILSAGKVSEANTKYTYSIYIKNNSNSKLRILNNIGTTVNIAPDEIQKVILRGTGNGHSTLQFVFYTESAESDFDFVWWHPKIEEGDIEDPIYSIAPEDVRTERIEKGTYTVIMPETYGETVIITAYDDMYKADKDYTTKLTFPQTAGAVLRDVCDTCDISLGSTSFLHDDFIIQNKPEGKFREVIGQIAMIACGNARIDRRNRLQIMPYNLDWGYQENIIAGENLAENTQKGFRVDLNAGASSIQYQIKTSGVPSGYCTSFITKANTRSSGVYAFPEKLGVSGKLVDGNKYTVSAYIRADSDIEMRFGSSGTLKKINVTSEWKRFEAEYINTNRWSVALFANDINQVSTTVYFSSFKFEEGSTATPWTPAPSDNLTPYMLLDEFTAPKIEYNDTVITGFKTIIKGETSEEDTEILQGTDTYCITVENPLISGKEDTVLSWLLDRIGNVPFRPFSGDAISNPLVEFMDLAKVKDRRGNEYNTFVTDVNFLMPGYTTLKNSTPSATRSAIAYTSNSSRVEQRARQLVEIERNARELAVERLSEALGNASGMYSTDQVQPDGSTIRYLHDKPTLSESKNIIKITSEAIGFSNDGETYPYGITLNGETITRILYAEGINADYINAGAITVRDDSGDIIFQVDMDTKSVTISGDHVRIGGKSATQALTDNLTEAKNYSDGKLSDYANTVSKSISGLQEQIDGQIETFYYDYEPTLKNIPASQWTSETEREKHQGDLFYDKQTGYAYRFFKDGTTWKWQLIQDTDITKAMQTAENAQDTADHKRRVFVVTPEPPYDIGDLWTNGDDILTCGTERAQGASYVSTDWQKLNKYTDDTVANQALAEAKKAQNLTIILDNEYQGIPTDSAGNYSGNLNVQTVVQTYYGHQNVSASCTYTQETSDGVTGKWDGTTRTYTVTALTADTGWVDITASYMNLFTVTKRFNVAKVRAGKQGEQGAKGDTGAPGKDGVNGTNGTNAYTHIRYSENADGSDFIAKPTVTTIYIGVYTGTAETAPTDKSAYTWSKYKGDTGAKGDAGKDGNGINSITYYYAVTQTQTAPAPSSVTGTKIPTLSETNKYLWQKEVIDFTDASVEDKTTVTLIAVYGDKGAKGDTGSPGTNGTNGTNGKDGTSVTITSTSVTYQAGSSGTQAPNGEWSATVPPVSNGQYLWTKTVVNYSDGTNTTAYAVAYKGTNGAKGDKGDTGAAGRTYFIELSANVLKRGANNAVTPATITANAYYRDGSSATRMAYAGRWIVATSTDGTSFTTVQTSNANESSKSYSVGNLDTKIVAVRFTLYSAGGTTTSLDMQTAPVVVDVANLTHDQIFNLLTNNGKLKGIYKEGNELYVNATYVNSGSFTVKDDDDNIVFSADIDSKTVKIGGMVVEKNLLTNEFSIFNYPNFTEADARKCLQAASGLIQLTPEEFAKYDMNKDGRLTAADARMIWQIADGVFPANGKVIMRIGSGVTDWDRNFEVQLYDVDGNFLSGTSMGATGVRINNSLISDFVMEQGTEGIWTYRKWYSGAAECWGLNIGVMDISIQVGNAWYTHENAIKIPFPEGLFVSPPVINLNAYRNTSWYPHIVIETGSTKDYIQYQHFDCTSFSYAEKTSIVAKGKWK